MSNWLLCGKIVQLGNTSRANQERITSSFGLDVIVNQLTSVTFSFTLGKNGNLGSNPRDSGNKSGDGMMKNLEDSGCKVTCHNFYTSLNLRNLLKQKNLTVLGINNQKYSKGDITTTLDYKWTAEKYIPFCI